MDTIFLYGALTAALFYLGSRALITSWLWNVYPPRLAAFMDCAACTGFWYGLVIALTLGRYAHIDFLGLPHDAWFTPIVAGLCSIAITPLVAALMSDGLARLGSALPDSEDSHGER